MTDENSSAEIEMFREWQQMTHLQKLEAIKNPKWRAFIGMSDKESEG